MLKSHLPFLLFFYFLSTSAQTYLRIHHKGGGFSDMPIENVDSITFLDSPASETELTGSWLWGDKEAGYYEVLTFNEDKTYTGYYLEYGFGTMTYGWYMTHGALLTIWSDGFGYNRRYNWYVVGLSDNALEVVTKMGTFTYYRIQPEILHLQISGKPLECDEGDSFIFADGIVADIVNGKIQGLASGTTYIQKYIARTNTIVAYKVVVE